MLMGLLLGVQIQEYVYIIDRLIMDLEVIWYVFVFYEVQFQVEGMGCVVIGKYV